MPLGPTQPLVVMRGIRRSFGGVIALGGVDLDVRPGEVHAIVGENGAGKSTLIRILGGAIRPDAGSVLLEGMELRSGDPHRARQAGIAIMHQELNLVPALSAADNVWLGQDIATQGLINRGAEAREATAIFARLGMAIDPHTPIRRLSVAAQQAVEIARALAAGARVIVMDEPTAALEPAEVEKLLAIVAELRARGKGIVYVSHRLDEIFRIADRITVLRDGRSVGTFASVEIDRRRLIEAMVGRTIEQEFPERVATPGDVRLEVRSLRMPPRVHDVSFSVRAGEIVGLVGLVGAGRTETLRAVFGAERRTGGGILFDGQPFAPRSPRDAIRAGLGLVPEYRKTQGLVLSAGVRDNASLAALHLWSRGGWIDMDREVRAYAEQAETLGIRAARPTQPVRTLSGGNKQKVVLAKWLARQCDVLLIDEPTRGIDVGAKREIYDLLNGLTAAGKAVVMATSELPEALAMCDRLVVLHEVRVRGEIADPRRVTQDDVLAMAVGADPRAQNAGV